MDMDNRSAGEAMTRAAQLLSGSPPAWPEPPDRKKALLILDEVFLQEPAPHWASVRDFYRDRFKQAVTEIEDTRIEDGARIWKFYNHGFVVRTSSVTIGFDIVIGPLARPETFPDREECMGRLAAQCDVLFISHWHGDHADEQVAQVFINRNKPVIAPPDVWKDRPVHASITHLERNPETVHTLSLPSGKLQVMMYPGNQADKAVNNLPVITTPEGITLSHMGDQYNWEDLKWIDHLHVKHTVDILLPACWTMDIVRVINGCRPKVIIPGHEHEMDHAPDNRTSYGMTYERRAGSDVHGGKAGMGYHTPVIPMTWGESFHYNREQSKEL